MTNTIVELNGQIINIGPWDYQYAKIDNPAWVDGGDEPELIDDVNTPKNPLPAGAVVTTDVELKLVNGRYQRA